MNYFKYSLVSAVVTFISISVSSAPSCRVLVGSENATSLSEQQIIEIVDKSKAYQDKRNKEWGERNRCLCCHTTLPYVLSRGMDSKSKSNFEKFKQMAVEKVENPESQPWYESDYSGRNSKPTEAVIHALTLIMYDLSNDSVIKPVTTKAVDRIFENLEANGRIHWLNYDLHPFESTKGELWGNSMAVLTIELAKKHTHYVPPVAKYNKLKSYLLGNIDNLKAHEMAVLLWADSQGAGEKLLTQNQKSLFIRKVQAAQNENGSFNQKAVLGYGENKENSYATAISLIGLIKSGEGSSLSAARAAQWLSNQQVTGNFLEMGNGTVLWTAKSMNRENRLFNDRFASDYSTSYSSLALQMYKTEVLSPQ